MKYLLKVIILFLIVFNFHVPAIHYSCTVAVIFCVLYGVMFKRASLFTYFAYRHCFTILFWTFLMVVINVVISALHERFSIDVIKRFVVQGYMLCCLVFALPFLIDKKAAAFKDAIAVICGAFALQGLIHLLGFFISPMGEFLFSLHSKALQDAAFDTTRNIDRFRFYSLTGSPFFELPAAYGVACILFFRMQLMPGQKHLKGATAFLVMVLLILGIALSGRTGFIGLGLGVLLYVVFNWRNFSLMGRHIVRISGGLALLTVIFYTTLTPQQKDDFTNQLLPFALEAYYEWEITGELATASTDDLIKEHYYPLDTETILWGRGGNSDSGIGFRHTDAGYMNSVMFGGVFYVLLLAFYQYLYFRQPMRLSRRLQSREGKINFFCFFILFAHMFILEYKGNALGTQHITEVLLLYIGFSFLIEQYALEDGEEE
ncbi:MAG: hypothetical protein LBF08_02180 [Dysgonamonadaceae bacterium]|jgi:hypothetical protein|nr:hypothetical protein [Dysgonamonadaceae bacterium]